MELKPFGPDGSAEHGYQVHLVKSSDEAISADVRNAAKRVSDLNPPHVLAYADYEEYRDVFERRLTAGQNEARIGLLVVRFASREHRDAHDSLLLRADLATVDVPTVQERKRRMADGRGPFPEFMLKMDRAFRTLWLSPTGRVLLRGLVTGRHGNVRSTKIRAPPTTLHRSPRPPLPRRMQSLP